MWRSFIVIVARGERQSGGVGESHLHLFCSDDPFFFGPSLRGTVGRGLHRHFKSITFFKSPLSERTCSGELGSGKEKFRRRSGLVNFFLSVLFIHCAGDAQYWWEDILVCLCGLYVLSFVVVFHGVVLVGRVY